MAGRYAEMRVGEVDVSVQVVPMPGLENTSSRRPVGRVRDAFADARGVIVAAAESTLATIDAMATKPDTFEVEFGIGFSMEGNVLVAAGSAEATLTVTLTYEAHRAGTSA